MAEPYRQTLISSRTNVNIASCLIEGRRVTPECGVPWSVRKMRLRGGRQEGVDLIEIDNGRLTLRIVPTRGMNILDARTGDLRLGWDSPVEEVVHPAYIRPQERGGLGWLGGFNEWLARCGLGWFGPPCRDERHLAKAEPPAGGLTLHGKVSNIPASEVQVEAERRPPYRIRLRALVREQMLFGPNLDLETEIIVEPAAAMFRVCDRVVNRSGQSQEYGLLYHVNQGRPILEEGAQFVGPVKKVIPRDERAAEGDVERYARYGPPQRGYAEQVYLLELYGARSGRTQVMLHNRAKDAGLSMAWSQRQLPAFTLWKNTAAETDGYVTGLEPGTNYPLPRPAEREAGRVPVLQAGGAFEAAVDYGVLIGKREVREAAEAIRSIQGGRRTRIDRKPPAG